MLGLFSTRRLSLDKLHLTGPRLHLRAPVPADWRAYARLRRDSREFLQPWEPTWPADALTRSAFARRVRSHSEGWGADSSYGFFLFANSDGALLGGITLSNLRRGVAQTASLGYWVGAPHARCGYMGEALTLICRFAFADLALHRLEAACLPANEPSRRLLRRAGFHKEGYARAYLKINGCWHDHILFARLAGDRTGNNGERIPDDTDC